ncbi:MAG: hypothetical protein MJ211_05305 [Bacteroidales bacterium]|nr:hypothetical protein [Bacteroidales bacterium]
MNFRIFIAIACCALVSCNNGVKTQSENSDNKSEQTENIVTKEGFVMADGKTFDLKGKVKEVKVLFSDEYIPDYTLNFDNEGKLVSCSLSENVNAERKDNKLFSYQNGDYSYTFEYNDNGFPIKKEELCEEALLIYELTYNENDELISEVFETGSPDDPYVHKFVIEETDAKGNWTKRKMNMGNGDFCWTETREIVYY